MMGASCLTQVMRRNTLRYCALRELGSLMAVNICTIGSNEAAMKLT